MKILITGGAGYIGATVCAALADAGHTPIILDSLVTGYKPFRGAILATVGLQRPSHKKVVTY